MARLSDATQAQVVELLRQADYPPGVPSTSLFRLLGLAPAVSAPVLRLAAAILTKSTLDPRLREVVILRIVARCQARYAWVQHVAIARAVGVDDAQLAALERGVPTSDLFTDSERMALTFADAILEAPSVADEMFASVRERFGPEQVVELLLTVGYFRMICSLMTTLDVKPEPAWAVHALDQARGA